MRSPSSALLICLLAACAKVEDPPPDVEDDDGGVESEPLSFGMDIAPMLVGKCTLCHHPDNPTGLDLTRPFDPEVGMINREVSWPEADADLIVDPGDPDNSFILDKVSREPLDPEREGAFMPLVIPRLSADEIATVRSWISDGAEDDDFYRERVAPIFGDGESLGRNSGKCAFCHYEGSSLPNLVDPFASSGVVDRVNARGVPLVLPGDPDGSLLVHKIEERVTAGLPMPLWLEPFSEHEVNLLRRWIIEGALEN
jgi:hypothetical protein